MIRILLNGYCGRMGRAVTAAVETAQDMEIVAGIDAYSSLDMPFPVFSSFADCDIAADVLLDFSRPDAVSDLLAYSQRIGSALVVATTGLTPEDIAHLHRAAASQPVFHSANFSLGINLLLSIVGQAAAVLDGFDIEVVETHHKHKSDAPSGTALMLADSANSALRNARSYMCSRHGKNARRAANEIGIHAIRGGTVAGDHEMMFLGEDEAITFKHHITTHRVFAMGALQAVRFMAGREAGFYNMTHVLSHRLSPVHIQRTENVCMVQGAEMEALDSPLLAGTLYPPCWVVHDEGQAFSSETAVQRGLTLFHISGIPANGVPLWQTAGAQLKSADVPVTGLWLEGHAVALVIPAAYQKTVDDCLTRAFAE